MHLGRAHGGDELFDLDSGTTITVTKTSPAECAHLKKANAAVDAYNKGVDAWNALPQSGRDGVEASGGFYPQRPPRPTTPQTLAVGRDPHHCTQPDPDTSRDLLNTTQRTGAAADVTHALTTHRPENQRPGNTRPDTGTNPVAAPPSRTLTHPRPIGGSRLRACLAVVDRRDRRVTARPRRQHVDDFLASTSTSPRAAPARP